MWCALTLLASVEESAFGDMQRAFVNKLPHRYHSQGTRSKVVYLPGAVHVTLHIPYFHRQKDQAKAVAKPSRGLYPALILLGIVKGRTPHVRQRMVKAAALLGSYEEAAEMLSDACVSVSVNGLREVCGHVGRRLAHLTASGSVAVEGHVEGRRIVVSLDGGRVRLREPRKGRTKKGYKRFSARWREPRLFIIYAVDEHGRMADDFPPIIDGTLASCDRLFAMLQAFLVSLGVTSASRILFVADGAAWIWRRIPKLIRALGLKADQVQELIDFWHAVEYLGKIAESVSLTGAKRRRWLTTQKKRLLRGEIGAVVNEIEACLPRRRKREQKTWLNYFRTHGLKDRRMDYAAARGAQMPIGSGAVESAIRRVINLRVKSNATYWLRENAETMIRVRAWIKAGRGESLFQQTTYAPLTLAL